MKWFLAKIVFRIICGDGDHTPQFDEQLRLIEALDETDAFSKAYSLGAKEQDTFLNEKQKLVQWQFINVSELYKLSELIDGAELYSYIQETHNAEAYISTLHKKAAHIQHKNTHTLLQLF